MQHGGTHYAHSPAYGHRTYTESYSQRRLSGAQNSTYATTYSKSYTSPRTDYGKLDRISTPSDYEPSAYTSSVGSTSRIYGRSQPLSRRTRELSATRSTPTDTAGRPLPKGPGTRDHNGRRIDHKQHIAEVLSKDSTFKQSVQRPLLTDRSRVSSHSTVRLNRSARTNSVADLTHRFEDADLISSKKFGSNADLTHGYTSTKKLDDFSSYSVNTRRKSPILDAATILPDINRSNKTSRSPSLDGRAGSVSRYDSDDLSTSSKTILENRLNKNSHLSNCASDYNNNNKGVVGLRNIGNTCFMNSVLQCLSNTKPLLEYCLEDKYKKDINTTTSRMKGELIKVYASLMKSVWKGTGEAYLSPIDFKSQIAKFAKRFVGYNQQDAQEFLIYLLEGLHEDVNRVQEKKKRVIDDSNEVETISASEKAKLCWNNYLDHDNSIIVELFVGQLRSALTCTVCGYESNTFDPFWDLSLPIPKNLRNEGAELKDCFNLFTQEEFLDGDERPTCAKCKKRQRCKKQFYIQRFPKVLIIHLKRFNQGSYYASKLSTQVKFPVNHLDLSRYADPYQGSAVYDLYAVSNHSGYTRGGHYTAFAKNPYSGKWHHFNDQIVTETSEEEIQSSEAYVLFYKLQNTSYW